MSFDLSFPATKAGNFYLQLKPGEVLYILGANGTGKSSLLQRFNGQHRESSRWISANRQTWLASDAPDMTAANKLQMEEQIQRTENNPMTRYRDIYARERPGIALQNLILSEHSRARDITKKVDEGDPKEAKKLSAEKRAPINIINDLFQRSNLSIHIDIGDDERLMARKRKDSIGYGVSEMSDGERNALLIAADVLTVPPDTLLLIDEPERHLHRSIAAPLLAHLIEQRNDCGFVISTHDLGLPMTTPTSRVLLLQECLFEQNNAQRWGAFELKPGSEVDNRLKIEGLKQNVLGARHKLLFVEGKEENSLDKPLYDCVFPSVPVIPKNGCVEVERAIKGLKSNEELHWLKIYGIVDGDGVNDHRIAEKRKKEGVYTLPYYSVEAIYYHLNMIQKIAEKKAGEFNCDAGEMRKNALDKGIAAIRKNLDHLSKNKAQRIANRNLMDQLPDDDELLEDFNQTLHVNGSEIHQKVKDDLKRAVEAENWEEILKICPIHESEAKNAIATVFGYRNAAFYEKAVIGILRQDEGAVNFVRSLFGDLANKLSKPEA